MASNMKGRTLLLKIYQSLNFYDQQFKSVVNENINLMSYLEQKAIVNAQQEEEDNLEKTNDETN